MLPIFSPWTAVVDLILNFLLLQCGYFGPLTYLSISPKHWHLGNLSYITKQQDKPRHKQNNIIKSINSGSLF